MPRYDEFLFRKSLVEQENNYGAHGEGRWSRFPSNVTEKLLIQLDWIQGGFTPAKEFRHAALRIYNVSVRSIQLGDFLTGKCKTFSIQSIFYK